jgi:thiosulfate dehydrogenase [quinone] large subunit
LSLAVAGIIGIFLVVAMAWLADVPRRRRAAPVPSKARRRSGPGLPQGAANRATGARVDRRGLTQGGYPQPLQASAAALPGQASGITTSEPPATNAELATWRLKGIGFLRIVFGVVWGIDAWFKWQPDFITNFTSYVSGAQAGQPGVIHGWINFWVNVVNVNPQAFAHAVAVGETLVALALLFGVFSNLTNVAGILLSVVIWTTAEGLGGPYHAGSTDVGPAIIYALVFVALFLTSAGLHLGLDGRLTPRLRRLGFLASGGWPRAEHRSTEVTPRVSLADGAPTVAVAETPKARFFVTKRFTKR